MAIVKNPNYTPSISLKRGIVELTDDTQRITTDRACEISRYLNKHPFGLEHRFLTRANGCVFFTLKPEAMLAFIRQDMMNIQALRIVYAQRSPENENEHLIYFESWTNLAVRICGSCTDFGDGGTLKGCQIQNLL